MDAPEPRPLPRRAEPAWWWRPAVTLAALICLCPALAVVSFRLRWGAWPEPGEALIGFTLLAPVALPMALADLLGLRVAPTAVTTLPQMAAFWILASALLFGACRWRSTTALVLLSSLGLAASLRWQDMAQALLGL